MRVPMEMDSVKSDSTNTEWRIYRFKILILHAVIVDARVALYGSKKVSKPGKAIFS